MKKVAKKLETSVAELIILGLFLIIFLSSCGSSYVPCPAYGSVEQNNKHLSAHGQENDYYIELANDIRLAHAKATNCENCDEID